MRQLFRLMRRKTSSFAARICGQWEPRPASTSSFGKKAHVIHGPGSYENVVLCSATSECGGSSTLATTLGASLSAFRAPYSNQLSRSITTASRPSGLTFLQPRASRKSFASTTGENRAPARLSCAVLAWDTSAEVLGVWISLQPTLS